MPRSRTLSAFALAALLPACVAPTVSDPDTGDTSTGGDASGGTSTDGTSPGGTSPGETSPTDDDTAGSPTGGAPGDCNHGESPWTFSETLDMPRMRGVGSEDQTCNPVTTDTITLELQLVVPEGHEPNASGAVRVLLFEYDPNVADAPADCVGGVCEPVEGGDLVWSFEVPNDLPELEYYVSVDLDDGNGCILHEVDFVTFEPAQGTLMVPMTASDCI